jgi:hypothetical protein
VRDARANADDFNSTYQRPAEKGAYPIFMRALVELEVTKKLGSDVTALLLVIAEMQDRFYWNGPVEFWNSQLTDALDFAKEDNMAQVRSTAIEAGLLRYHRGCRGTPGRYFVTIPSQINHPRQRGGTKMRYANVTGP